MSSHEESNLSKILTMESEEEIKNNIAFTDYYSKSISSSPSRTQIDGRNPSTQNTKQEQQSSAFTTVSQINCSSPSRTHQYQDLVRPSGSPSTPNPYGKPSVFDDVGGGSSSTSQNRKRKQNVLSLSTGNCFSYGKQSVFTVSESDCFHQDAAGRSSTQNRKRKQSVLSFSKSKCFSPSRTHDQKDVGNGSSSTKNPEEKQSAFAVSQNSKINPAYFKSFPPGFRFLPTDVELIFDYLVKRVEKKGLHPNKIQEVNLYDRNPQELADNHPFKGDNEWYFFTPTDRKYPNGIRPNRKAGGGYWKATGADTKINHKGKVVGLRKALVFYEGKAPKGEKTNWIMHEYRLNKSLENRRGANDMKLSEVVLCRIHKKSEVTKKTHAEDSKIKPDPDRVVEHPATTDDVSDDDDDDMDQSDSPTHGMPQLVNADSPADQCGYTSPTWFIENSSLKLDTSPPDPGRALNWVIKPDGDASYVDQSGSATRGMAPQVTNTDFPIGQFQFIEENSTPNFEAGKLDPGRVPEWVLGCHVDQPNLATRHGMPQLTHSSNYPSGQFQHCMGPTQFNGDILNFQNCPPPHMMMRFNYGGQVQPPLSQRPTTTSGEIQGDIRNLTKLDNLDFSSFDDNF